MAFDPDKFISSADEYINRKQEENVPEPTLWDKTKETVSDTADYVVDIWNATEKTITDTATSVLDTADNVIDLATNTANDIGDAYHNYIDAQQEMFNSFSEGVTGTDEQKQKIIDMQQAGDALLASPLKESTREFVNAYADEDKSLLQGLAQNLRRSATNINYFMTDDEKLAKANDIQNVTGISAESIINDNEAYKTAMEIYDYTLKEKKLVPDGEFTMDKVWKEFPGLKELADTDPQTAALALHDISSVRETKGVIDTFTKMYDYGTKKLEYDNLKYKEMIGNATENDKLRMSDLKGQMAEGEVYLPSFFDEPLAYVASGIGGSMPEMLQGIRNMAKDASEGMIAGALAGAAVGTAGTPIGTAAGGLAGGIGGGIAGATRGYMSRQASIEAAKIMSGGMARYGMFTGMYAPETGDRYSENSEMKDKNGNRLLSDEAAQDYAMVGGALNAGIEMANFGVVTDALKGSSHAANAIKAIIGKAQSEATARQEIKDFVTDNAGTMFKVAGSETFEEGLQSASDDIIHNDIEVSTNDTTNGGVYSPKMIAARSLISMGEALPSSIGFGIASSFGGAASGSIGLTRNINRIANESAKYDADTKKTIMGTMMLERLQQVVAGSKLKDTAPAAQEKLIRNQLNGTGYENAYIDVEMALTKANGIEDLQKVADAAGYTKEDLQTAIESNGQLFVPVEKFAQVESSPDLLESVSFSPESDALSRVVKSAKYITDKMQSQIKTTIDNQMKLADTITSELFTDANEKDMATAAIYTNPENPAQGWNELYKNATEEKQALIQPAVDALKSGMKQGISIVPTASDYGMGDGGIKVSNNDMWYSDFYKKNGRAPTKQELESMAEMMITGDVNSPKIAGFMPSSESEYQSLESNKEILKNLNENIRLLDSIKGKMSDLTGVEMTLTNGLSSEAFGVYRDLNDKLKAVSGMASRAARMDAILFARHADIVANVVSKKGRKPYSAKDYYRERFMLDTEGRFNGDFGQLNSLNQLEKDINEFAKVVDNITEKDEVPKNSVTIMTTPLVMKLAGAKILPIKIDPSILRKILLEKHKEEMPAAIVRQLPKALTDPLMILKSFDKDGQLKSNEQIVVVDLKDANGATIMVPFILNASQYRYSVNKIKSAYGRTKDRISFKPNDKWYLDRINEKNLLYINRKKIIDWKESVGTHNGSWFTSLEDDLNKLIIPNENDLSKLKEENNTLYQKKTESLGSITKLSNGQRVISLFEKADESTFMHEMSHMFLMDLEELAKIDEVSAKELEIVNEWATWHEGATKDYKNTPFAKEFAVRDKNIRSAQLAGDIETADKLKAEWRQERFARAFEMYMMRGQAPVKGLKAVFRKFKQFLKTIYIGFTSSGGNVSPKIEAVMARMIASEEEINAASLDDRYKDISKVGGEKLFTESETETYQRWHAEAMAEAKEKLQTIIMKDLTEENRRKFAKEVEQRRKSKLVELQNERVYLAEQVAKMTNDENMVLEFYDSIEEYKAERAKVKSIDDELNDYMRKYEKELDKKLIENKITDERIAEVMESTPYHKKLVALEARAFAEKEKMINRIDAKAKLAMQDVVDKIETLEENTDLKVEKDNSKVKEVFKAINRLRFASKWNQQEFNKIEHMLLSNTKEEIAKAIDEFKKETAQEKANIKAIEDAEKGKIRIREELAKKAMREKSLFEACNYNEYRRLERIAATRVEKMIKAKNWTMAAKQQEARYMAAAMANESKKIKEHIDSLRRKVDNQLKVRSIKLPKDERYWHKHLAYILRLDKEDAIKPVDGVPSLEDIFRNLNDSHDIDFTPINILEMANQENFNGYHSLTVDEFEDAVNALTILYTTGRDKFKMKTIEGKDIADVILEISEDITGYNGASVKKKRIEDDSEGVGYNSIIAKRPGIGETLAQKGQKYLAATMKPEEMLKMIGEKAHKYIFGTYEKASNIEAKMTAEYVSAIRKILSVYSHSEKMDWKKKKYIMPSVDEKLSKENIICMALNWGNEINIKRLCNGMQVSESEVLHCLQDNMTKKDWETVQKIWDYIGSYWDDTVKVEEKLNGITIKPQASNPFTVTVDGEELHMKGGYYPIKANPKKNSKTEDQEVDEVAKKSMTGSRVLGTGRGFTKTRSEFDINRMLLLEFSVIPEHLGNVIHNIAYRIAARDVYRLINHQDFQKMVEDTMGRDFHRTLREWATDCWRIVPNDNNQANSLTQNSLGWLRRNSTMAIMGYRVWPAIENATNIFPIMDKIGITKAIAAVGDFYAHQGEYTKLLHKSMMMKNRINNMDRDIRSHPGMFDESHKAPGWLKEHAYSMMVYSDLMFSAPLWCKAYKDAFSGKLLEVKTENNNNINTVIDAQEKFNKETALLAEANSKINNSVGSNNELQELRAEVEIHKKALFKAEIELDKASQIQLLTDADINREAERRAIMSADASIRETFGSGATKDLASIQRGSELTKLLTTFYSYFNTQANAILAAYYKGKYAKQDITGWQNIERWAPFAKAVLFRIILPSAMATAMKMALLGDGSDDKNKYRKVKGDDGKEKKEEVPVMERFFKQLGKNTISTTIGSLWGIRELGNLIVNLCFDGTDFGRGVSIGGVATRAFDQGEKIYKLSTQKSAKDEKIEEKQAKEAAKYSKMTRKQKKAFDEKLKYRKPEKRITYTDIAKATGGAITTITAAKTGITDTMANTVFTTMQYLNDSDGRYDNQIKNIIWSAVWNKKPVEVETPEKPEKPKKKKRRENN